MNIFRAGIAIKFLLGGSLVSKFVSLIFIGLRVKEILGALNLKKPQVLALEKIVVAVCLKESCLLKI